jgi:ubiquinone/menaquinone biosynthesis C-methylase UbiE
MLGNKNFRPQENYEKKVKTAYSELGQENLADPDIWGNAVMDGKNINIYHDPEFIKKNFSDLIVDHFFDSEQALSLVDFGGAEGHVIKIINEQLNNQGYKSVTPVDLDINLGSLRRRDSELPAVQSDLSSLPLKADSVDAGILRFVLPYNTLVDQELILQNLYRVLKPGGRLIILQDGAYSGSEGENYNEFYAQASAAQSGQSVEEVKKSRYFSSGEELKGMATKAGLQVAEIKELTDVISYLSPQAYVSRFKMDDSQQKNLQQVFRDWEKSKKLEFDSGRLKRTLLRGILNKIT